MSMTGLDVFDITVQKTNIWLNDLMKQLGWADRHKAYLALRGTLLTLRDRLSVEEAVHLGAQLPMLVRGMYYDGWDPSGKPLKMRHKEDFLSQVHEQFRHDPDVQPEAVARAVFRLLAERISKGEIEDVKGILPETLRELWPVSEQARA